MHCKSYSHFFSKKFQHICESLDVNFNESLTNNVVSFEQLGPDCFISGLSVFLASWGWVTVTVYFNMFFREAKPRRCRSFCHFGWHYPTMQLRHHDALFFMFNVFPPFNPSIYMLLINIWTTSDWNLEYFRLSWRFSHLHAYLFKKFRLKVGIFRYLMRFFKNFMRHEKSCFSVTFPWFLGDLTWLSGFYLFIFFCPTQV